MSQVSLIDIEGNHPQIPTSFTTDSGIAIPIANNLEILATYVSAQSIPIQTVGSGNTITIQSQITSAIAASSVADAGLASFDSASFSVNSVGFVQLIGGGAPATDIDVDAFTAPGTDPVVPLLGHITLTGNQVASGVVGANVIRTNSLAASTATIEIQRSNTAAASNITLNGVAHYDSSMFSVDANGFVSLNASASFTTGSVIFWGATAFSQDNANFFWDDTNNRFGVGLNTPLATFHVVGAIKQDHTSTENDDHAIEIVCNAAGFSDVKAMNIDYITGAMGADQDEEAILVNIDETLSTGGIIAGYLCLTTSEGLATVNGYETGININPLVHQSGSFGNADYIRNKAVNVTAALAAGGAGAITAFVADNDTFTIGEPASFNEIEVILTTPASGGGIGPTFEYSTGAATFAVFNPADGTNGFRETGAILLNSTTLSGWVAAASGNFEIRITRTRNVLITAPVLDEIQVSSTTEYRWDKNGDVNIHSLTLVVPLTVPNGGTGNSSLTDHGIMLGSGAGAVTVTAAPTNGQLLIGSTGVDPVLSTLTAGTGIGITNAAGSITIATAATVAVSYTTDSGSAVPAAGIISVVGLSGSKTSGATSVITVKSPPFSQIGASATSALNTGEFVTAAVTRTLPASAGLADGDLFIYVCTSASALIIQSVSAQKIRVGSLISAAAGTATSSAIGDSLTLRFNATDGFFYAVSVVGVWTVV